MDWRQFYPQVRSHFTHKFGPNLSLISLPLDPFCHWFRWHFTYKFGAFSWPISKPFYPQVRTHFVSDFVGIFTYKIRAFSWRFLWPFSKTFYPLVRSHFPTISSRLRSKTFINNKKELQANFLGMSVRVENKDSLRKVLFILELFTFMYQFLGELATNFKSKYLQFPWQVSFERLGKFQPWFRFRGELDLNTSATFLRIH